MQANAELPAYDLTEVNQTWESNPSSSELTSFQI